MNEFSKALILSTISGAMMTACGGGNSTTSPPVVSLPTGGAGGSSSGGETGPVVVSNIEYGQGETTGSDKALLMDIYQPSSTCEANRPTVFFVHGGGFTGGDKTRSSAPERAEASNDKGYNFVSINYRLAGDNPVLSSEYQVIANEFITTSQGTNADPAIITAAIAAMEDSITALNWMEANADTYCFDTTRLAYWGSSAGAFTVLNVAYTANEYALSRPEPDVVINYWGDLLRNNDLEFMEAPFLTIHGDNDPTVDYQGALDLATQADDVGVPYSFYTDVGGGHGVNGSKTVNGVTLLELTVNFIEAHVIGGSPLYETANVD